MASCSWKYKLSLLISDLIVHQNQFPLKNWLWSVIKSPDKFSFPPELCHTVLVACRTRDEWTLQIRKDKSKTKTITSKIPGAENADISYSNKHLISRTSIANASWIQGDDITTSVLTFWCVETVFIGRHPHNSSRCTVDKKKFYILSYQVKAIDGSHHTTLTIFKVIEPNESSVTKSFWN